MWPHISWPIGYSLVRGGGGDYYIQYVVQPQCFPNKVCSLKFSCPGLVVKSSNVYLPEIWLVSYDWSFCCTEGSLFLKDTLETNKYLAASTMNACDALTKGHLSNKDRFVLQKGRHCYRRTTVFTRLHV